MEAFTHLSVLISIILGLGIAELLSGLARLVEGRVTARLYEPPIVWAFLLLLIQTQTWWSIFGMRAHVSWTFFQFSVVLLQPIVLYMLSALALPHGADTPDLRAHYFARRKWFFVADRRFAYRELAKDIALSSTLPSTTNLLFHLAFFSLATIGFFIRVATVHRALAYSALIMIGVYIALLFVKLS